LREFKPSVTINNTIPTVDMDLRAERPLLHHAPHSATSPFMTNGMRTLDEVLSHMDNPNYDVKYFTILERIVHSFHMQEVWHMTRSEYLTLQRNPPSASVCQCANDLEANGVMRALRFTALAMREPELIYGEGRQQYYVQYQVTYHFGGAANKYDGQAPLSADNILLKESDSMPELVDETSWAKWREILTSMDPNSHKDLALYLFCALNQA
jgi:hypothetical protein